jgi:hypothetical protein
MSNWPLVAATRYESLGLGTGVGTTVTANASANVKGSYATIGTAGFRYSGFVLSMTVLFGSVRRARLDIAINTGGADTIIVEDYYFEGTVGTPTVAALNCFFPVCIPSGATIKARIQCSTGSEAVEVSVVGVAFDFAGPIGASRMVSCSDFTNTAPTNTVAMTGTSYTAWTTIKASTPARISRLWLAWSSNADTTRTACEFIVDIGIGSAGNEVVLASLVGRQASIVFLPQDMGFPCDIPAAKRLAFRIQAANGAANDSFGVCAMGLAA